MIPSFWEIALSCRQDSEVTSLSTRWPHWLYCTRWGGVAEFATSRSRGMTCAPRLMRSDWMLLKCLVGGEDGVPPAYRGCNSLLRTEPA